MAALGRQFASTVAGHRVDFTHGTMVRRLRNIYEATPDEIKEAGRNWYPAVHDAVLKNLPRGRTIEQGAAVVASVSPNMDWDNRNINAFDEINGLSGRDWDAIHRSHAAGHRTPEVSERLKGLSISAQSDANLVKAHRLWVAGEHPQDVLNPRTAPKTYNFAQNIAHPERETGVTVDGRHSDMIIDKMRPWDIDRGIGSSQLASGRQTRYERYSNATAAAARRVSQDHGIQLMPHELQATTWEAGKHIERNFDPEQDKGDVRKGQSYQRRVNEGPWASGRSGEFAAGTSSGRQ